MCLVTIGPHNHTISKLSKKLQHAEKIFADYLLSFVEKRKILCHAILQKIIGEAQTYSC